MRPFPGELQKRVCKSHPYTLNDDQKEWMREVFPVTENKQIMAELGVSWPTLHKLSNELGLKKNPDWLKSVRAKMVDEHKRMNRHHRVLLMSGHKITRCTNLRLQPYTKRQIDLRRSALNRGYLLDEDISEGSSGRYAIYYDEETQRSERFEATCRRHGLTLLPDPNNKEL